MTAMSVVLDEKLADNAEHLGKILRAELKSIQSPMIGAVRGKGLFNAIDIIPTNGKNAWDVCIKMKDNGLLAKPTHDHTIRFAPALVMTEEQLYECVDIIKSSVLSFSV